MESGNHGTDFFGIYMVLLFLHYSVGVDVGSNWNPEGQWHFRYDLVDWDNAHWGCLGFWDYSCRQIGFGNRGSGFGACFGQGRQAMVSSR